MIALGRLASLIGAGSLAVLSFGHADERPWSFPSSAADMNVRAELIRAEHTQAEHRNIQSTMENLSGIDRTLDPDRWRSKEKNEPVPHPGFYVLHEAYGYPKRNGWRNEGFQNQRKQIEDIVAHGDRVAVVWKSQGTINGKFFGFEGVDQPIDVREMMVYRYDATGKSIAFEPWSGEDLVLFEQLGGRLQLPKRAK